MAKHKHIDLICIAAIIICLLVTILFSMGETLGIQVDDQGIGYETRLFQADQIHTIDIVMDDWDSFIETCDNEAYSACTVVIDGEKISNVGIRAKGNTSLSNVKSMDSERYSFKIEFDQYEDGKSYHGLDKLCLNNLIQDNTMMKDFIAYQLMYQFGVDAPLSSYTYITVNGEDWGLYLAVEAVEDSFLERNYDSSGDLYKPDSLSFMGGGDDQKGDFDFGDLPEGGDFDFGDFSKDGGVNPGDFSKDSDFNPRDFGNKPEGDNIDPSKISGGDFNTGDFGGKENSADRGGFGGDFGGGFGGFGMGSSDVKLQYVDDNADSYSNIFDNAKTDVSKSDQKRLISSLKSLSEYSNLEEILDMDEVLRYFVIHTFTVNGDSYTGSMIHNYYLHEENSQLSMIPWDYNLAFGTFQGGDASNSVNSSIDNPIDNGNLDERPMIGWIFSDETYTEQYHTLYNEFMETWYDSGKLESLIRDTEEMIAPYVKKDPTKFCTVEEFEAGVDTLSQFVSLRCQAIENQLRGDDTKIDTTGLQISTMGTMGGGEEQPGGFDRLKDSKKQENTSETQDNSETDQNFKQMPEGMSFGNGDFQPQNGADFSSGDFQPQNGDQDSFERPDNMNFSGFPGKTQSSKIPQSIYVIGSIVVLLLGLLIAKLKKW